MKKNNRWQRRVQANCTLTSLANLILKLIFLLPLGEILFEQFKIIKASFFKKFLLWQAIFSYSLNHSSLPVQLLVVFLCISVEECRENNLQFSPELLPIERY